MRRVVYLATGLPEQAASDLKRLQLSQAKVSFLVVAHHDSAGRLAELASLRNEQILPYKLSCTPMLWLRLASFLGFSFRSEIICLTAAGPFRLLKLLALTLPASLFFSDGEKRLLYCSRIQLLRAAIAARGAAIAARGPLCLIGSASPEWLKAIAANIRKRYPDARLHGLIGSPFPAALTGLFDSFDTIHGSLLGTYLRLLPRCFGKGRFRELVLPCTNEGFGGLKWLALFLPVWRVEAYNEYLGVFSARNPVSVLSHGRWRIQHNRETQRRSLPVGVIGSASVFSLKKILPIVRATFPDVKIHGLLPAESETRAHGLFDSITVLQPGIRKAFAQCWKLSRQPCQCWVIPCTDEPYTRMKLLAALVPLDRRYIYNELGDGFAVRKLGTFYRHIAWRLREHLSFQIIAATAGSNPLLRLLHLVSYALRLLVGAAELLKFRLRSKFRPETPPETKSSESSVEAPRVDLILLDADGSANSLESFTVGLDLVRIGTVVRLQTPPAGAAIREINAAVRNSHAEFICLMDARCRIEEDNWLDRLIESFDERTAQVGPQIVNPVDGSAVRGGLLDGEHIARWNSDNAVCWHGRPDWLSVEALPWVCVVLRRSVFLKIGYFRESCDSEPMPIDLDFCRRLAAHGWRSICNQTVTVLYPVSAAGELEPAGGVSSRSSEDRT